VVGTCECGDEHSGSIKCGEFLDWLRVLRELLKKESAPWSTRGADKSLARPGRKKATATEDFDVHISYL